MSALGFTETSFSTIDANGRSTTRQWKNNIGITEDEEFLRAKRKLDFFRSMGLELCNSSVLNDDNNNDCESTQANSARPCLVPFKISKISGDTPEDNSGLVSRLKQKTDETSYIGDSMPGYLKLISHIKECRVTIIGDKCKICGKNFKCIKDVQTHARKKHRKRKPRKKIVLKIGDEVITKVSIKKKHLKFLHRDDNDLMIVDREKTESLYNKDHSDNDRSSEEDTTPFVDLDSDCDIIYAESPLREIKRKDDLLKEIKHESSRNDTQYLADDDEEIQVLLKITRSRESGPEMEINHETPNRTERELLISDAIREFVRMDNEAIEIVESDDDDLEQRIPNDSCWLANENLPNSHLNLEERNYSFHIENMDDIECSMEAVNLPNKESNTYLNREKSSLHSEAFANRNVHVIIPNLKDFEQSLNNPIQHERYTSNVDEMDAPFYTDVLNDWGNLRGDLHSVKCPSDYNNAMMTPTVLIKEEIMLDDF